MNECLFGRAFEDVTILIELAAVEGTIVGVARFSKGLAGVGAHEDHSMVATIGVLEHCEIVVVVVDAYYLSAALIEI